MKQLRKLAGEKMEIHEVDDDDARIEVSRYDPTRGNLVSNDLSIEMGGINLEAVELVAKKKKN